MKSIALPLFALLLFITFALPVTGEDNGKLVIDEWLQLGPVGYHHPVYYDIAGIDGTPWSVEELLLDNKAEYGDWMPEEGKSMNWSAGSVNEWHRAMADQGELTLPVSADDLHQTGWVAAYVTTDRWLSATFEMESPWLLRVFLNGEELVTKTSTEPGAGSKPGSVEQAVSLQQGTHLLLVKMVRPSPVDIENENGETPADWTLKASLDTGEHTASATTGLEPERKLKQRDLSHAPRPSGVSLSPDGELAAVHVRRDLPPDGTPETRIDIRSIADGELFRSYAGGMTITGMQWVPEGRRFSYTVNNGNGTDLWLVDLDTGEQSRLLKKVEDFAGYLWSPNGRFVIYSVSESHEPGEDGVMRYHGLQDRRPGYHTRSFLYQLNVPEGTTRRLTAGLLSTALGSIHPDGSEILFLRSHEVYDERPYGKTEYVTLDLNTMDTDSLFTVPFGGAAHYSPSGDRILITGGPNTFGDIGVNIPDTLTANDYDTQAYIFHRENREIEPVTRDFDPAISAARWDNTGRYIYFTVTEKAFQKLYRYDTRRKEFRKYETAPDVAGVLELAQDTPVGVFTGSGASDPPKVWTIDFNRDNPEARVLYDPGADFYRTVRFGDIKPWAFTNTFGEEIDGHVYYPPDFDEDQEYPVIVYYYGGTVPTSRAFGGRYPKELYAAKGYLVYVLQPSGATGFGQEFSARHVNDWGEIAGNEIITGTEAFLENHPYANREKVGAIGASYGGFMTMYLLTRTDLFATAVSHAGISNLTSYWGEGFWGYQYSGVATAHSFPWNRRDIYVDQSPIFNAEDIHTPLLLITGMQDTNVPPGESLQMFTALKLLGRDVAFVAVEEQDHHILDYKKNIHWKEAILSWFDKWLKEEPEWWQQTHGD